MKEKFSKKAPTAASSCPRICAGCPMAEFCHPKTVTANKITLFSEFSIGKTAERRQSVSVSFGGPVPEVWEESKCTCNESFSGSCPKHQKAA